MKSLILAVCVLVSLSACQNDSTVGSGPLTLSPDVQEYFDKYMKYTSPVVFAVSTDGNAAEYLYCPEAYDGCIPGINTFHVLESCEKLSGGVPCKIYAREHRIVWEGAIHGTASEPEKNVSEQSLQQARNFNGRNDEEICKRALSGDREKPNWDNKTIWREYVNEAKRRDFTPQHCAKLVGWNTAASEKKPPEDGDVDKRLTKLKKLFEKGLITKDEYDKKRGEILEAL